MTSASSSSHADHLRELAAEQRRSAGSLRDAIADALPTGMTWREIGEALGIPHETVFRQYQAGAPVVVVRTWHRKPEEGEDDAARQG